MVCGVGKGCWSERAVVPANGVDGWFRWVLIGIQVGILEKGPGSVLCAIPAQKLGDRDGQVLLKRIMPKRRFLKCVESV